MLDILFSFQFIWISFVIVLLSILVGYLCARLHSQLLQAVAGEWLVEHIYCPIARILILMCMTLLLFPLMAPETDYQQVVELFLKREYLTNMMNILFVTGLLIAFFPLLNHPAFAMPLLGSIATAILFHSYISLTQQQDISYLPDLRSALKIIAIIMVIYWINRWLVEQVSTYIDHRFIVSGSRTMVMDICYMILQIPVMLAYAGSLLQQIDIAAGV